MTLAEFVGRLQGVKPNQGDGHKAKCPGHDDSTASLTIAAKDGKIVLRCWAGCEVKDIVEAMGLELSDLFAEESKQPRRRVTLAELAARKCLDASFLRSLGITDTDKGIAIPYRDANGETAGVKGRSALVAKEGSWWVKPVSLPYGVDRLADAREFNRLVLVEGETDCWTLWHHAIPALGIPGADRTGILQAEHVAGIAEVFAFHEPDQGGDKFVAGVKKRLAELGYKGTAREIRLDGAKDPSDLHVQDHKRFVERFEAALKTAPKLGEEAPQSGFKSVRVRLKGERVERLERAKRIVPFPITFLQDALGGIFPNDLILIGGASGEGKTALMAIIAHSLALLKKRAHYFALEAEENEIERRLKYREISDMVYGDEACRSLRPRLNYIDWYKGELDAAIGEKVEARLDEIIGEKFETLETFYKKGNFGGEELERELLAIQSVTDAAFVDHLNYVDVDGDNENRGVKAIVQKLRDLALMIGKPIFLAAHLRKRDRKGAALVPELEDFHGTSDTPKISTKAIMIAKARDVEPPEPHLWPTYVYAPKCRMDGSRTRYGALMYFNARMQTYEPTYKLGRFSASLDEFQMVPEPKIPSWAQHAWRKDYSQPTRRDLE